MENTSMPQDREKTSPTNSPNSNGSSSNSTGSSSSFKIQTPLTPKQPPPPISRSAETTPYPTTFVQADTSNFKQVVQMLTGSPTKYNPVSSDPQPPPPPSSSKVSIPPIKNLPKKQGFKLYERRNSLKNGLMISPLMPHPGVLQRKAEILSPSILDFPSLVLSPVTPLIKEETFDKSSSPYMRNSSEEEKAIAEKKFYLHPSPRMTTPRESEPRLLPLFPVTSPRVSGSSS